MLTSMEVLCSQDVISFVMLPLPDFLFALTWLCSCSGILAITNDLSRKYVKHMP